MFEGFGLSTGQGIVNRESKQELGRHYVDKSNRCQRNIVGGRPFQMIATEAHRPVETYDTSWD